MNAGATMWWEVIVEWCGRAIVMSRPSDDVFDVAGTAVSAFPAGVGVEKKEEEEDAADGASYRSYDFFRAG
jgi:hypothetical protein